MPTVRCNGLDLSYIDVGQGEAIVFLNGLAGDHLYWLGQVRALSSRFRCLSLDNRDVGQSSYANSSYTVVDLADDVFGLLDAVGVPAAHVVGLSLGGMIAQEMALRRPERVRSLALLGTLARVDGWFHGLLDAFTLIRKHSADNAAFFETVLPWMVSHRFYESTSRVEWLRALFHRNPYQQRLDGFFRQVEAIRQFDTLDRLGEIRCPVLVGVGEDDWLIPQRYARQLAEKVAGARVEVLPGVGHAPPIEAGRALTRLLEEFLPLV